MKNYLDYPNDNEIREIGERIRDCGYKVSNADIGAILSHFVGIRRKPELSIAARRAIDCFKGCTLTPEDADAIVQELGYVAHGWVSPIRKYPS